MDAILAGCLLALAPLRSRWLAPVGWAAIAAMVYMPLEPMTIGLTATTLASVAVVAGARPGFLSWRPLVRVGQISCGLYLYHLAPALLLRAQTQEGNFAAIALVIAAAFLLAFVSERWIELP